MNRNLNGEKRAWILLWILAVISLFCIAKGQGLASHPKNMHSLPDEKHHGTVNKKVNHEMINKHNGIVHGKDFHETVEKENKINPERKNHGIIHTADTEHPDSLSIPVTYKLYWIGLIFLVIFLLVYFLIMYKKEKFTSLKPLTIFLLLLALSLYLLEQGRIFTGYFDPVKGFVSGFHEPNTIGFLRFLYKLIAGVALSMYGFIIFFAHKKKYRS